MNIMGAIVQMMEVTRRSRFTMHEIADWLGVQLNTISGRFGRMVDKEILMTDGTQPYKRQGRLYPRAYYRLVNPPTLKPVEFEDHTMNAVRGSDGK